MVQYLPLGSALDKRKKGSKSAKGSGVCEKAGLRRFHCFFFVIEKTSGNAGWKVGIFKGDTTSECNGFSKLGSAECVARNGLP